VRSKLGVGRHRLPIRCPSLALLVAGSVLALACQDDDITTTTRNLERPAPMALFCAARDAESGVPTTLPLQACDPSDDTDDSTGTLFGLVANSARGDVALFETSAVGEELIDLDPGPGFGFAAVGALPTALETTTDGCRAVTANSGSCDLSVLDVPGLLEAACLASADLGDLDAICPTAVPAGRAVASRITPRTREGPLLARPQDLLLVPPDGASDAVQGPACAEGAPYRAFVTFPACGLVAQIDLATGLVIDALVVTADGFRTTDTPRCPVECSHRLAERQDASVRDLAPSVTPDARPDAAREPDSGGATSLDAGAREGGVNDGADGGLVADGGIDAGADAQVDIDGAGVDGSSPDGSGGPDAATAEPVRPRSARPFALALRHDGSRLFVSNAAAGFITAIDLNSDGSFAGARPIALAGEQAQTKAIAVSPPHPVMGEFVYAVAADRSVRVVSVGLEAECETNADLALVLEASGQGNLTPSQASCFALADDPPRRVTADGPGLEFGSLVPRDVAFVAHDAEASDEDDDPERILDGIFALIALSDGSVVVVDVADDDLLNANSGSVPITRLPHRIRADVPPEVDASDFGTLSISGQRTSGVPVVVSEFAGEPVFDEGQDGAAGASAQQTGGVILRAIGESGGEQRLVFEQQLLGRFAGQLRLVQEGVGDDTGPSHLLRLDDRGARFCANRVLGRLEQSGRALRHGDIVRLEGCETDSDCGLGQACRKPLVRQSETGLCLDEDGGEALFTKCQRWLRQERDYLVRRARAASLVLDVLSDHPQRLIEADPRVSCDTNADCPDTFYCVLELGPVEGSERWTKGPEPPDEEQTADNVPAGVCARAGCNRDRDCPNDGICIRPLDGSPPTCALVPPPIDPWPLERWGDHAPGANVRRCTRDDAQEGAQSADACQPEEGSTGQPCEDDGDCPDNRTECRRTPGGNGERTCQSKGLQCVHFEGRASSYCVRASPCFTQLQRYSVFAGRSFRVSGGFAVRAAVDANGNCATTPDADPLLQDRIPLGLAVYPFISEPQCEQAPAVGSRATPLPNACFELTAPQQGYGGTVSKRSDVQGKALAPSEPGPAVIVRYANPRLALSLGVSHLSRVGDSTSDAVDRRTGPPLPERGLTLSVRPRSLYVEQFVRESADSERPATDLIALPGSLVVGPDRNVYLSDMGDRAGNLGSRGQVRRIVLDAVALDERFLAR
jgi:hypothetical protein